MNESESRQQRNNGGRILKEAREAQGISLETIHAATKIPMDALRSIEEGYKVRTLTPFYVKGFVKMYAQYLNVDVNKVLEDYHPEQLPAHIPDRQEDSKLEDVISVVPKEQQKLVIKIIGGIILLLLVFKVGSAIWGSKSHPTSGRTKAAIVTPESKKGPLARRPTSGTNILNKAGDATHVSEHKNGVSSKGVVSAKPAVVETAESDEEEKVAPVVKKVRLTIRARKSGWLQVKVDGDIVFQSTLEEGSTESWTAQKTIELSGKNIHNLEYELNGRVLGGLGREDRSARRVVVTSEGLSVKNTL